MTRDTRTLAAIVAGLALLIAALAWGQAEAVAGAGCAATVAAR